MSRPIIIATFIGRDGSMGFQVGKAYKLEIDSNTIYDTERDIYCPYGSVQSFLKNWTEIKHV